MGYFGAFFAVSLAADLVKNNEGLQLKPYKCTSGKRTIGYGRNLDDKGITEFEANWMLEFDLEQCIQDLRRNFPFFQSLTDARKAVLIDMRLQMGGKGFRSFKRMLAAVARGDYSDAAHELLDSKYAIQTPARAENNAHILRTGEFSLTHK